MTDGESSVRLIFETPVDYGVSAKVADVCPFLQWAQWITRINPLRYLVEVMRTIYLRGGGFAELLPQLGALLVFALVFNLWAVKSYRKSS